MDVLCLPGYPDSYRIALGIPERLIPADCGRWKCMSSINKLHPAVLGGINLLNHVVSYLEEHQLLT